MDMLFVKPAPGRIARHEDPPHAPILPDGEAVPASPYYLRQRDLHGDTVDARPPDIDTADAVPSQHCEGSQPAAATAAPDTRQGRAAGAKRKPSNS